MDTNPKRSRRTCTCEYGLQPCRGKSAGVSKLPRERSPTRNPSQSHSPPFPIEGQGAELMLANRAQGIVNVIGMPKMTPPIKDLLPRLTPILKNRHEKVQENCIDLVGAATSHA
jgi:hypothetical protein